MGVDQGGGGEGDSKNKTQCMESMRINKIFFLGQKQSVLFQSHFSILNIGI